MGTIAFSTASGRGSGDFLRKGTSNAGIYRYPSGNSTGLRPFKRGVFLEGFRSISHGAR